MPYFLPEDIMLKASHMIELLKGERHYFSDKISF
jgi:hypothetical protein